jgi:hypothetical protein
MAELKHSKYRLNTLAPEQRYRGFGRWPQTIVFTDNDIIEGSYHLWASWVTSSPIPAHGPHTHNDDEMLVFMGSDTDNKDDLGCEVEICMGPEMEKHIFRESTLVYIPANLVHGPIRFRNFKRPFIFIQDQRAPKITEKPLKELVPEQEWDNMVFFDFDGTQTDEEVQRQYQKVQELTSRLKESPEVAASAGVEPVKAGAETKYGKYFLHETNPEQRQRKFGSMPSTIVYTDNDIIEGSHLFWALWRREPPRPGYGHGPHSHNDPESILTLGGDPNNPQDLGVESEDYMGTEMEKYVNDKSNLILMPAGFVHGPATDKVYRKPWIMAQCQYAPKLTEKSYKKLVAEGARDNLIFFDLKGTETDEDLAKQREGRPGAPPKT